MPLATETATPGGLRSGRDAGHWGEDEPESQNVPCAGPRGLSGDVQSAISSAALRFPSVVRAARRAEESIVVPPQQPPPTFEGRVLPRPDEELVDQGLGFDVGTLLSRRRLLGLLGIGAATVGLAACGAGASGSGSSAGSSSSPSGAAAASGEIPDETAGPYPGDGSNGPDVLEQSGIVRRDIRSSFGDASGTAEGVPMTLELDLTDLANGGVPFQGAAV